jgi:twitching motility two-component system response regulator PilH
MPGTDGFAATRQLRADAETKDIAIVFVSSKGEKADKVWGQMLGARGYVTKPYSDEQILEQIAA